MLCRDGSCIRALLLVMAEAGLLKGETMHDNTGTRAVNTPPLACSLPEAEQHARREAIATELAGGYQQASELADGYAFRYPGDAAWAARLLEFIAFERGCCPFFAFELVFEPHGGPLWLRLRGPAGSKAFIADVMGVARLPPA